MNNVAAPMAMISDRMIASFVITKESMAQRSSLWASTRTFSASVSQLPLPEFTEQKDPNEKDLYCLGSKGLAY